MGSRIPHPTQPQARQANGGSGGDYHPEHGRRATNAPVQDDPSDQPTQALPQSQLAQPSTQTPAGEWSKEGWRQWITDALITAKYAVERPNGRIAVWVTDLSNVTGIHKNTLLHYVRQGQQPSPLHATALARALGLHPLTVVFRAGLIPKEELLFLVGAGSIPSPEDLRESLEEIEYLPDSLMKHTARASMQQHLQMVESMSAQLGLSPEEFGPVAAEIVKREIVAGRNTPRTPVATPDVRAAAPELTASDAQAPQTPEAARRTPGPRRKRSPRPGVDAAPDAEIE